jgi:TrmH family RNA methyltransferase
VAGVPNTDPRWAPATASALQRAFDLVRHPAKGSKQSVLEDAELILHCLAAGVQVIEVYVEDGHVVPEQLVQACEQAHVPIRSIAPQDGIRIFKSDKRAHVFAVIKLPTPARLTDILERTGDVVVLDGVRIVGNIGAIVRSAFALGAAGVVLVDSNLDSVADRRLLRASRGYVFSLPTVISSAAETLSFLHGAGLEVAVFEVGGAVRLDGLANRPGPVALVFGSERYGPSSAVAEAATIRVTIPMRRGAESLNVSVACAVAVYARSVSRLSGGGSPRLSA